MHLTELIECKTFVAISWELYNGQVEIGAVRFKGWEVADKNIKDLVRITDKICIRIDSATGSGKSCRTERMPVTYDDADNTAKLLKFIGTNIIVVHKPEDILLLNEIIDCSAERIENRILDNLSIAKSIYRDKIKDYSMNYFARRFSLLSQSDGATGAAVLTAMIFGRLALEDDFAHCRY